MGPAFGTQIGPAILGAVGVGLLAVDVIALARVGCIEERAGNCVRERNVDALPFTLYAAGGAIAIGGAILWHLLGAEPAPNEPTVAIGPGSLSLHLPFE